MTVGAGQGAWRGEHAGPPHRSSKRSPSREARTERRCDDEPDAETARPRKPTSAPKAETAQAPGRRTRRARPRTAAPTPRRRGRGRGAAKAARQGQSSSADDRRPSMPPARPMADATADLRQARTKANGPRDAAALLEANRAAATRAAKATVAAVGAAVAADAATGATATATANSTESREGGRAARPSRPQRHRPTTSGSGTATAVEPSRRSRADCPATGHPHVMQPMRRRARRRLPPRLRSRATVAPALDRSASRRRASCVAERACARCAERSPSAAATGAGRRDGARRSDGGQAARAAGGPSALGVTRSTRAEAMKSALGRARREGRGRSLRQARHRARPGAARLHHAPARPRSASWCCTAAATPRCKPRLRDLAGDEVDVLCVKGSGWDMGDDRARRPARGAARRAAQAARARSLSDEDMVRVQRANLIDPMAPNPSVETLLHAFLPHKFVDHTHATAVLEPGRSARRRGALRARSMARAWASCPTSCRASASPRAAAEVFDAESEGRRPDPRQARHLHFRRQRARSLRAHDRDGDAGGRRGLQKDRKTVFAGRAAAAADRAAGRGRADPARRLRAADARRRRRVAAADPRIPHQRRHPQFRQRRGRRALRAAPASSRPTTPSAPRTGR